MKTNLLVIALYLGAQSYNIVAFDWLRQCCRKSRSEKFAMQTHTGTLDIRIDSASFAVHPKPSESSVKIFLGPHDISHLTAQQRQMFRSLSTTGRTDFLKTLAKKQ